MKISSTKVNGPLLKIGYFADGPWAQNAFNYVAEDQTTQIRFICTRYHQPDLELEKLATDHNIVILKSPNINSNDFLRRVKSFNCDLFVSMSFNQIFRKQIISLPPLGIINCHAGKLPFYRGRNVLNWCLINDEKEFGITVHYVDEGIDTGDIIFQRCFPITDQDTYATLLEMAHIHCAKLLYEAIKQIQENNAPRIPQVIIHPVGFYCGRRISGDEIIRWDKSSRSIFNFIRALCDPGPKARSFIDEEAIRINRAEMVPNAPSYIGTPGEVLGLVEDGFYVKTLDSLIKIVEYEFSRKLRIGDRLSSGIY